VSHSGPLRDTCTDSPRRRLSKSFGVLGGGAPEGTSTAIHDRVTARLFLEAARPRCLYVWHMGEPRNGYGRRLWVVLVLALGGAVTILVTAGMLFGRSGMHVVTIILSVTGVVLGWRALNRSEDQPAD
jgi:hypothetical protein